MKKKRILAILFYIFCAVLLSSRFFYNDDLRLNKLDKAEINKIKFIDATSQAHVHFVHRNDPQFNPSLAHLVKGLAPFFEAISSSVSVVDINNDGWSDFFAPSSQWGTKSELYINNHDGTFTEKAADYGLADLQFPTRAGFFDCDNSGTKAMFLTTFNCPILYTQDKKHVFRPHFFFSDSCTLTTAFNIYDYNRDGLLDIVIAPFSRTVPNNWHGSDNGPGGVMLFKNIGNCRFAKAENVLNEDEKRFTHAIGVGDFRGQNTQDLWAATDFNLDRVFFEKENKNAQPIYKKQKEDILLMSKAHNGMSLQSAYIYDNQIPSEYVSHVYQEGYATNGNQLWTYDGDKFIDSANELRINNCGWSWGSSFSDIDNDGKEDLVVANGFISGSPDKNYWKKISRFALGSKKYLSNPWNWSSFIDVTWSGYQRDCVFYNTGHGFINISEKLGIDNDHLDGRGLASIDVQNDGRISFLVSNQKQALKLYKNESDTGNNWVGFTFIGTQSNRDAIGANVWLELSDGRALRKTLYPFNGYSAQQDSRIHFGLGQATIKSVKVVWPSGLNEHFSEIKANRYYRLVEGKDRMAIE